MGSPGVDGMMLPLPLWLGDRPSGRERGKRGGGGEKQKGGCAVSVSVGVLTWQGLYLCGVEGDVLDALTSE